MKKSIGICYFLLVCVLAFAQNTGFSLRGNYKKPILKEDLKTVKTLNDINAGFPSSWIASYESTVVAATSNGQLIEIEGKNANLSPKQISLLQKADIGTPIIVDVKYQPTHLTATGEIRTIHFEYDVIPNTEAQFPSGDAAMKAYIKEKVMAEISDATLKTINRAAILFSVSEQGKVQNIKISESSENEKVDQLMLQAIQQMPDWTPAYDAKGNAIRQEFEFSIGLWVGC